MKSIMLKPDAVTAPASASTPALRQVLTCLSLTMLLPALGTSIANVALPTLSHSFNASFQQVQWVVLAYLLAVTSLIVGVGRLGDLTGRRRLLLAGIFVFTLASILCAVAPTLGWLIAARTLQGLGAAIMMALTMALAGDVVPKEKTGSAMGLLGAMSATGTALGPALGGMLIAGFGWRAIFLVTVPLGLAALLLAQRVLRPERVQAKPVRLDLMGMLMLALTLGAYVLAVSSGAAGTAGAGGRGHFSLFNLALLCAAALGLGLFVYIESRVAAPLLQLALLRDPGLSAACARSVLVTSVVMATLVVGPFYLAQALAQSAVQVGLIMSSGPIVAAITGVPAGRIVDRFGAQRMSVAGLIAMLVGCTMLALLSLLSLVATRFGVAAYITPLVVLTAGYALFQAANNTAVMSLVGTAQRGVISGMLNLARNLGLITGASARGTVFALACASAATTTTQPDAVALGMRVTFAVAAALIVLALGVAALSRALAPGCAPEADSDRRV